MNAFIGKPEEPTDADLAAALRRAKPVWDQLLIDLARELGVSVHEWRCYSRKAGWSLRAKCKARTIVWLSPSSGCFTAHFILGEKAMRAARESRLPQRIVKALSQAPKYPEGTGVRLEVRTSREIGMLKRLAAIKVAN